MASITYSDTQNEIIRSSLDGSLFLEGPAGSGKTTAALGRLGRLLEENPGHQILVLVPQRSLGMPYQEFMRTNQSYRGSLPSILTLGGLARRMINLFWPLVAQEAGFHDPLHPPQFLSLETAQYCMAKIVNPYRDKGYFDSVTIENNRLYSQIIDNLNKAAVVRFPLTEIAQRLRSDQNLDPSIATALDQTQKCALDFRKYCLENNLLDYSLQIETFLDHVWPKDLCRKYFHLYFQNLIYDNIEEDVPAAHDLVREWLSKFRSALLILDQNGGYRTFLGADPLSAQSLQKTCKSHISSRDSFQQSQGIQAFKSALTGCIRHEPPRQASADYTSSLSLRDYHFYPEMIAGITGEIDTLVHGQSIDPGQIVILAPYLSDVLKFTLTKSLEDLNIPSYSSRPSRMYLEDPAVKCVLTLAKLAHTKWDIPVSNYELRDTLLQILPGMDIMRADLIVQTLYSERSQVDGLRSFDSIVNPGMQERITFTYGKKIEVIRTWLQETARVDPQPLDIFLSRLFGELLSQNGFGFYADFEAAERVSQLIYSIKSFRQFLASVFSIDDISAGIEFIKTLEAGLLPSVFLPKEEEHANAILIAPAHSFLMENRPVANQFWLDIGSMGWWERLNQPLTNPYILRRGWQPGQLWTDAQEYQANQEHMQRIVEGLLNRCRRKVYVSSVQVNEYGSEQRGALLRAFHTLRKRTFAAQGRDHV